MKRVRQFVRSCGIVWASLPAAVGLALENPPETFFSDESHHPGNLAPRDPWSPASTGRHNDYGTSQDAPCPDGRCNYGALGTFDGAAREFDLQNHAGHFADRGAELQALADRIGATIRREMRGADSRYLAAAADDLSAGVRQLTVNMSNPTSADMLSDNVRTVAVSLRQLDSELAAGNATTGVADAVVEFAQALSHLQQELPPLPINGRNGQPPRRGGQRFDIRQPSDRRNRGRYQVRPYREPGLNDSLPSEMHGLEVLNPEDRAAAFSQRTCPVSREVLGSRGTPIKIAVDGKTIFVCCESCAATVQRNPERYFQTVPQGAF